MSILIFGESSYAIYVRGGSRKNTGTQIRRRMIIEAFPQNHVFAAYPNAQQLCTDLDVLPEFTVSKTQKIDREGLIIGTYSDITEKLWLI